MTREGKRRAAVLLALKKYSLNITTVAYVANLPTRSTKAIVDVLVGEQLAIRENHERCRLADTPAAAQAQAEARALLLPEDAQGDNVGVKL